MSSPQTPESHVIVLFGAGGDLAHRKLLPALLHLVGAGLMPEDFRVIESGRNAPDGDFADEVHEVLAGKLGDDLDAGAWEKLGPRLSFVASSADDGEDLAAGVRDAREELGEGARVMLYLSVPPSAMLDM